MRERERSPSLHQRGIRRTVRRDVSRMMGVHAVSAWERAVTRRSRRDQVGGQERPPRVEKDVRIVLWAARRA